MLLAAVLEGVSLLLLVPILDLVMEGPEQGIAGGLLAFFGLTGTRSALMVLLAAFLAAIFMRAQVSHMRDMAVARIQTGFAREQRIEVVERLAAAGWDRLAAINHARIQNIVVNDVSSAVSASDALLRMVVAALIGLVNIAVALWLAPEMAWLVVLLVALAAMFLWASQEKIYRLGDRLRSSNRAMLGSTQNLLAGLKTALAQESQGWFTGEFAALQDRIREHQLAYQARQSATRRMFAIATAIAAATLIGGGFLLRVDWPVLVIVVVVLARLSGPALVLQQNVQQLLFALPGFAALERLRSELPALAANGPPMSSEHRGSLVLRDASYRHPGGGGVGPVSLTIAPSEIVGIEGPSGAGKSTLVDLLAGLLEPQTGAIRVGDTPLEGETLAQWRARLSFLGQQVYLFDDSLRANLLWDRTDTDAAEMARALEMAGLTQLVAGLEQGLDTPLGEGGVLFSGGERQRIALARALLRRPRVLIMDEATSALDIASEEKLLERLGSMPDRPTIIAVAHRRESLAFCDRVLLLDDGKLVGERRP